MRSSPYNVITGISECPIPSYAILFSGFTCTHSTNKMSVTLVTSGASLEFTVDSTIIIPARFLKCNFDTFYLENPVRDFASTNQLTNTQQECNNFTDS